MPLYITEKCNGCNICFKICPVTAVNGKKEEQHSIDTEKCIECLFCGRLCPENAINDEFGIAVKKMKKSELPKPEIIKDKCTSCVICIDSCPTGALTLGKTAKSGGDAYPELDVKLCIGCGFCENDCPVEAVKMV